MRRRNITLGDVHHISPPPVMIGIGLKMNEAGRNRHRKQKESLGIKMTLADTRMMALERAGGGTLLRTLSLAAALIFALPLPEAVSAASATEKSDKHFAGEDAVAREMPSFGLPPIVVCR